LKVKNIQGISEFLLGQCKKFKDRFFGQNPRVFKNPIVCIGIIILILVISIIIRPSFEKEGFLFSGKLQQVENQNLFFEQKEMVNFETYPFIAIEENSFKQAVPVTLFKKETLGALTFQGSAQNEIIEYVVQPGDSLSGIAQKFGLCLNTVLWANDLSTNSTISPGQKLTIPPTDGLIHLVENGDSIGYLAELYRSDTAKIIAFNELSDENEIFIGDLLIIPDGKKPARAKPVAASTTPLASSYFICPIPAPCGITQGLHWYNAVDFSNGRCGEAVFAAAGGKVQRTGYDSVAGKYVRILHPNGVVTFYGHLSSILVVPGQKVSQGELIGYIGNTGYTIGATGCHVHFEVRGARNPFAY
jgi:LysM repeat protein